MDQIPACVVHAVWRTIDGFEVLQTTRALVWMYPICAIILKKNDATSTTCEYRVGAAVLQPHCLFLTKVAARDLSLEESKHSSPPFPYLFKGREMEVGMLTFCVALTQPTCSGIEAPLAPEWCRHWQEQAGEGRRGKGRDGDRGASKHWGEGSGEYLPYPQDLNPHLMVL